MLLVIAILKHFSTRDEEVFVPSWGSNQCRSIYYQKPIVFQYYANISFPSTDYEDPNGFVSDAPHNFY